MPTVIETRKLTKRYGDFTALDDCDLTVPEGSATGLLGKNGAGKTTLLRLLLGFLKPTSGQAAIRGLDTYRDRERLHRFISYLPGEARSFGTMRGIDVVRFFCTLRDDLTLDDARSMARRLDLDLRRWVAFMSTGMKQKLGLAVTLATQAPIVILDEPTTNLDPTVRGAVIDCIREMKCDGRSVLVSSHVLSEIENACDSVAILDGGRIVHRQSLADLTQRHRIRANCLGDLAQIPAAFCDRLELQVNDQRLDLEVRGELSDVLEWLATLPLRDVVIERMTLRQVYDQVLAARSEREVSSC